MHAVATLIYTGTCRWKKPVPTAMSVPSDIDIALHAVDSNSPDKTSIRLWLSVVGPWVIFEWMEVVALKLA